MNNWAEHILKNNTDKIAIIDDYGQLTYHQLSKHVLNYASYLQSRNIKPKDRILITSNNNSDSIIAILGATYIGATVCMLSPNMPEAKILQAVDEVNAKLHIKDGDKTRFNEELSKPDPYDYLHNDEGFMLASSGTTGYQKFIVHRHSVYFDYFNLVNTVHGITCDSVVFCGPKIHWGYGYTINLIPSLGKGATIILTDNIKKPKEFCQQLKALKVTHLFTVPAFGELLVRAEPTQEQVNVIKSLKHIFIAGDIFPKRLRERFHTFYGRYMHNGWGQTEVLSYAILDHANNDVHTDYRSIGTVINGCEIKIKDNELYVKSPCQALGYLNDPVATAETFKGEWVRTNDIVELDHDYIIFKHRRGNRFKIRGQFYSVDEVEQTILETGLVYECLVTPQIINDKVSLKINLIADQNVIEAVKKSIRHFKIDKQLIMSEQLPKTYTNKKLRLRA